MIPEGQPSEIFRQASAAGETLRSRHSVEALESRHSSEAPPWHTTGMASTTMEAMQMGPALLPQLNKKCAALCRVLYLRGLDSKP